MFALQDTPETQQAFADFYDGLLVQQVQLLREERARLNKKLRECELELEWRCSNGS
jgi:hypothetical protein